MMPTNVHSHNTKNFGWGLARPIICMLSGLQTSTQEKRAGCHCLRHTPR